MQGKRVYAKEDGSIPLQPGEYGIWPRTGDWMARTPNGHLGNLKGHDVTVHDDGTITVSPSIGVYTTNEEGKEVEVFHGYLERGVWREV